MILKRIKQGAQAGALACETLYGVTGGYFTDPKDMYSIAAGTLSALAGGMIVGGVLGGAYGIGELAIHSFFPNKPNKSQHDGQQAALKQSPSDNIQSFGFTCQG